MPSLLGVRSGLTLTCSFWRPGRARAHLGAVTARAEWPRSLEINDEIELHRLLDGQVFRLGGLQDAIEEGGVHRKAVIRTYFLRELSVVSASPAAFVKKCVFAHVLVAIQLR